MTDPSPALTQDQVDYWIERDAKQRQELEALKRENERLTSEAGYYTAKDVVENLTGQVTALIQQLASREELVKELEADLVTYKGLYAVALAKGDA